MTISFSNPPRSVKSFDSFLNSKPMSLFTCANQWNPLNISIIERTCRCTVPWYSTRISFKFAKSIWCCVWISLTRTGRRIAWFLNLMLNDLNLGLLAVIFNISISLKPTTLSAVLNRSFFAPPLLASVKTFFQYFFPSPIFKTLLLPRNSSELSLPRKKEINRRLIFSLCQRSSNYFWLLMLLFSKNTILNYKKIAVKPLTNTGKFIQFFRKKMRLGSFRGQHLNIWQNVCNLITIDGIIDFNFSGFFYCFLELLSHQPN